MVAAMSSPSRSLASVSASSRHAPSVARQPKSENVTTQRPSLSRSIWAGYVWQSDMTVFPSEFIAFDSEVGEHFLEKAFADLFLAVFHSSFAAAYIQSSG